jgi:hypothetical protein
MSWLNRIFDVFSRRNKVSLPIAHNIPNTFRNRVLLLCKEILNSHSEYGRSDYMSMFWDQIHLFLQYRHGTFRLSDTRYFPASTTEDAIAYLVDCTGEEFLDFLEYIFRVDCFVYVDLPDNQLVEKLNDLLRIDDLPYYITDFVKDTVKENTSSLGNQEATIVKALSYPKVIMRENELVHNQSIKPVLELLQCPQFSSADSEFLDALEDYRKGNFGDCLTKCGSALESVMKILCERKGWPYNQTDTASTLTKTILGNTQLESYFESVLIIVATLRNRLSKSHGAGTTQRKVPPHLARFSINATASVILLIVDEAG